MSRQDKEILKLSKLCQHWANHNESHKASFLKWRTIAHEKGLESVVENLENAIKMMDNCNEYLLSASRDIEN